MNVAVIGTGLMGFPMAQRLLKTGNHLTVYNRTQQKAERLSVLGAEVASSVEEAIVKSECIILVLSDARAINEVMFPEDPYSFSNKTIIQMGTIAPNESRGFHQEVIALGGEYIECPVLGSIKEAREGKLILMVGAHKDQFKEWEGFLKVFGPEPKWIGEVGRAAALKLALNQLIASLINAFSLSLGYVQRQGVNVDEFMDILKESALYAPMFTKKLPRLLERNFSNPNFPAKHLLKDVDLILEEAKKSGLSTDAIQGIHQILLRAVQRGFGEEDYSALYNIVNPRT